MTHVSKLIYRQVWRDPHGHRVAPTACPPPRFRVGDFDASLENDRWAFVPFADFCSEESARAVLEPRLRDWEIEWDLVDQLLVSFEFDSCILEEPPRVEGGPVNLSAKFTARSSASASITVARANYPSPPSFGLHDSSLARQLLARWHGIEDGREKLLSGAYWFVTTFESEFGVTFCSCVIALVSFQGPEDLTIVVRLSLGCYSSTLEERKELRRQKTGQDFPPLRSLDRCRKDRVHFTLPHGARASAQLSLRHYAGTG